MNEAMMTTEDGLIVLGVCAALAWGLYGYMLWRDHYTRTRRRATYVPHGRTPAPDRFDMFGETNKH